MRFNLRTAVPIILILSSALRAGAADLQRAQEQYQRTDYAGAINVLLTYAPKSAAVNALIGKSYYMNGQYKSSTAYLEKAVSDDPSNSSYFDWLGRAYGRRAEQSTFLSALPFAVKTREAFERATALDSANLEALGDLFEFYLQAPAIIGGGVDKAEAIAVRIGQLSEPESHYVRARLAEKRKLSLEAESEYRKAAEAAPRDVGRVIDLAAFLSNQGRYSESDELFQTASQTAPLSPKVMFARASAYVRSRRNLPEAERLLERYAELPHTPDDPPRAEVARLMQKLR
jgi:Tfp pilus assembly protein PilF